MSSSYKISPPPKGNHGTFPFIVMPVSPEGGASPGHSTRRNPDPVENARPSKDRTGNGSRRSTDGPRDLRPRIPVRYPQPELLESANGTQEQLRRPPRPLYPNPSQSSMNVHGVPMPCHKSRSNHFDPPYEIPADQVEEIYRAAPSKFRRGKKDRAEGSTSLKASQLMTGSGDLDRDREHRRSSNSGLHIVGERKPDILAPPPRVRNYSTPPIQDQLDHLFIELGDKGDDILSLKKQLSALKESLDKAITDSDGAGAHFKSVCSELTRVAEQAADLDDRVDVLEDITESNRILALPSPRYSSQTNPVRTSSTKTFGTAGGDSFHTLDFDGVIRNIRELNILVGSNQSMELCFTSSGATFRQCEAVTITLFKNGYTLSDSSKVFRAYGSVTANQFFQDIYDGYFPSELQCKYPDGIPIIVKDKRKTLFAGTGHFAGKGHKLSDDPVEFLPKFYPGMKFPILKPNDTVAREAPSIESASSQSSTTLAEPSSCIILPQLLLTRPLTQRSLYKSGINRVVTLKLKNIATGVQYKIGASISSTPDDLLQHLEKYVESGTESKEADRSSGFRKFELINGVPFGVFSIGGATLREYGILSNTLIYFRPI